MSSMNQNCIASAWFRKGEFKIDDIPGWMSYKVSNLCKNTEEFEKIKEFSRLSQQRFLDCSLSARYLYDPSRKAFSNRISIQEHLRQQLNVQTYPRPSYAPIKTYPTILLASRTGEGKTTMIQQLIKETQNLVAKPILQTNYIELHQFDSLKLNVIDTQSLDLREDNQIVLNSVMDDFILHVKDKAEIDAIIVMWCPIKNGRSGLMKTLQNLRVAYGEKVLESCIVMIQGNWKPFAEMLGLTNAVKEAIDEIEMTFPRIPIIKYDVKGHVSSQIEGLKEAIKRVKPYTSHDFEEQQKEDFFDMISAINFEESKMESRFLAFQKMNNEEKDLNNRRPEEEKDHKFPTKSQITGSIIVFIVFITFMFSL